jgi:hypothetical protein
MKTSITDKLVKIIDDIDQNGYASLTRLTVLKKWFEKPGRLVPFAVWIARLSAARKGKTSGEAGKMLDEARALIGRGYGEEKVRPKLNKAALEDLHDRMRDFQNERRNQQWAVMRTIKNWNLLLVEKAFAIVLWYSDSPGHGYELAVAFAKNYDSKYGDGLNGPSRTKIMEMLRLIHVVEGYEELG